MTYREMYDDVMESGKYNSHLQKIKRLAQLIFANHRADPLYKKSDAVWEALEKYEDMSGCYFDPTFAQFDDIVASIA